MIVIVYSDVGAGAIGGALGAPEYSYWFVREIFRPALETLGIVVPVTEPATEVAPIVRGARTRGEEAVFFCFEPPHKVPTGLGCRTIPVFAWEFDTLPDEAIDGDTRQDWTRVLRETGSAVTHSSFSAAAVRRSMGAAYPVASIPAPVWDRYVPLAAEARGVVQAELDLPGIVLDAAEVDLTLFSLRRAHEDGIESLHALARVAAGDGLPRRRLPVAGVVYAFVFNPLDGRKNFTDLLGAFIWTFRDQPEAVLILKPTFWDPVRALLAVLTDLAKFGPFRCRVLIVHGLLNADEYAALVGASTYAVNVSTNEGQCLPLMEWMSAGRPAIAPLHTSMLDYLSDESAFVVRSFPRPAAWPHDPRNAIRTHKHVVSVAHLAARLRESFRVARDEPRRYAAMSIAASRALHAFCSLAVVTPRLQALVETAMPAPAEQV